MEGGITGYFSNMTNHLRTNPVILDPVISEEMVFKMVKIDLIYKIIKKRQNLEKIANFTETL